MSKPEQDTLPAPVKAIRPVVAWKVDDGEHAAIIFHHHGLAARREGASQLDVEFDRASCTRALQFDQYAPLGKVPVQALLEAGWFFYCQHCDMTVRLDGDEEHVPLVAADDTVYCSQACMDKQEAIRTELDNTFAQFQAEVMTLRPDLTFTAWHGGYPMLACRAHFHFPGCTYPGTVVGMGDGKGLRWSVAQEDTATWATYEASREAS
ncbi:hypothetical protein [Aeromonas dhakensis]|uniref:hypothetical protein n=1 Tax=Aeromonas dhakensis TaxID=196024 RepID=UPI00244C9E89|nr:hypothetical protein [Aeromonas dhakensis]MDH0348197.1 hypothetical protein [Aeromonas dhakensis]